MFRKLRDPLIALSLSNLCFIGAWRVLMNPGHYNYYYYWKTHPQFVELASLLIDIVILAAIFWTGIILVRRSGKRWVRRMARVLFVLLLIIPINDFRLQFEGGYLPAELSALGKVVIIASALTVLVLLVYVAVRWSRRVTTAVVTLVLIVSPFFLVALAQATWLTLKSTAKAELGKDRQPAPLQAAKAGSTQPRIIWILFDELGYAESFENGAQAVRLPELSKLRAQSLSATQAFPPSMLTSRSIPSLFTGKMVKNAAPLGQSELVLELDGGEKAEWAAMPNVFSRAREAGFNTALVGWAHPYCRLIGDDLNSCHWESICFWDQTLYPVCPQRDLTLVGGMLLWPQKILFRVPGVSRLLTRMDMENWQAPHTESYLNILQHSEEVAANPAYNLSFFHFPVPHCPCIYKRSEGRLSINADNEYVDNVVLADNTLGQLRRRMESAGLWDNTIVLVTSDHWLRGENKTDKRIPFILKMPGQKTGASYDAPFNSVLSHDLVLALLNGELKDAAAVPQWLDRHRSIVAGRY